MARRKAIKKAFSSSNTGCASRLGKYARYAVIVFSACCIVTFILSLFAPETDEAIIPTLRVLPSAAANLAPAAIVPVTQPVDESEAFTATLAADKLASQTADAQTQIVLLPSSTMLPAATNEIISSATMVATTDNQAALAPIFASATAAMIQAQSIRPAIRPSATRSNPTALPTVRSVGMTMYISDGGVRARSCPRTDCEIITTLSRGDTITVYGTVDGMNVSGSPLWYEMEHNGRSAFVYSAFVQQYRPSDPIVRPAVSGNTSSSPNTSSSNQSQTTWNCSGDRYNCGNFNTCSEVMSYWNACPGDPSGLDGPVGSSSSGVPNLPCESLCG